MYVGRFVVIAPDRGAYRVSSRSFPHRRIIDRDGILSVVPTPDAPQTDNPYVSYNCARRVDGAAILGNGSHVDPIAEKLALGYPARDAVAEALLALDYEKDDYDTPRLAGVIGDPAVIGIVRRDALLVETVTEPTLVATYEKDAPEPVEFVVATPQEAAIAAFELDYEYPVCAASAVRDDDTIAFGIENGSD